MLFIKKIKGDDGVFSVIFDNVEVGKIKDKKDFMNILKSLLEKKVLSQKEFDSFNRNFDSAFDILKKGVLKGICNGVGFFSEKQALDIHSKLIEATRKPYLEMDEASRKNYLHMISSAIFPN